jgi:hypothetical protein
MRSVLVKKKIKGMTIGPKTAIGVSYQPVWCCLLRLHRDLQVPWTRVNVSYYLCFVEKGGIAGNNAARSIGWPEKKARPPLPEALPLK